MTEDIKCPKCGSEDIYYSKKNDAECCCMKCLSPFLYISKPMTDEQIAKLKNEIDKAETHLEPYPQAHEPNEYRYLSPAWLDEIAKGLTEGQEKYPGETWRKIPAKEHAWRAIRHLILFLKGDKADTHLINAAMRTMMAFETDKAANDVIEWEKLMHEKGCG